MLSHANNHDGRVAASATRLTLPALGCMLLHSLSAVPSSCAESGPMHASRWTQAPKSLPRLQLAWDEAAAEWFTRRRNCLSCARPSVGSDTALRICSRERQHSNTPQKRAIFLEPLVPSAFCALDWSPQASCPVPTGCFCRIIPYLLRGRHSSPHPVAAVPQNVASQLLLLFLLRYSGPICCRPPRPPLAGTSLRTCCGPRSGRRTRPQRCACGPSGRCLSSSTTSRTPPSTLTSARRQTRACGACGTELSRCPCTRSTSWASCATGACTCTRWRRCSRSSRTWRTWTRRSVRARSAAACVCGCVVLPVCWCVGVCVCCVCRCVGGRRGEAPSA